MKAIEVRIKIIIFKLIIVTIDDMDRFLKKKKK